jgi:hypothetical protein
MMMVFFMDITSFRLGFVIPSVIFLTSEERADGRIRLDKRTRAVLIEKTSCCGKNQQRRGMEVKLMWEWKDSGPDKESFSKYAGS